MYVVGLCVPPGIPPAMAAGEPPAWAARPCQQWLIRVPEVSCPATVGAHVLASGTEVGYSLWNA